MVAAGFPLLLSECSFTICLMPYNCKYNVLSVSLNKTLPSFYSLICLFNYYVIRFLYIFNYLLYVYIFIFVLLS